MISLLIFGPQTNLRLMALFSSQTTSARVKYWNKMEINCVCSSSQSMEDGCEGWYIYRNDDRSSSGVLNDSIHCSVFVSTVPYHYILLSQIHYYSLVSATKSFFIAFHHKTRFDRFGWNRKNKIAVGFEWKHQTEYDIGVWNGKKTKWWRVVAGGDTESCFLYLICHCVRKYFNLITTTYFVMQEVPNIYLCIHFQEKICNTFVLQFKVS